MPNHPDNFGRNVHDVKIDTLAEGVLVAEVELSKALVNYGDHWGVLVVRGGEEAAVLERNSHHLQVVGLHKVGDRLLHFRLARGLGLAFQPEGQFGIAGHGHRSDRQRGGLNAGNRSELVLKEVPGSPNGLRGCTGGGGERQPEGEHVVGVESRINSPEPGQAANHQSGPRQQDKRQRHFRHHEDALSAMTGAA